MKESLTNPLVIVSIVIGTIHLIDLGIGIMAKRNPKQDAWDKIYSVTKRVVAFIEQNERQIKYSHKLTTDDKIALRNKAIGMVINELEPKVIKEIEKNKASGNEFREVVAQVVEHTLLEMKKDLKK